MSALTEALVAAQAKALAALERAYVAGMLTNEQFREQMDAIGCTDVIEQDLLSMALATIKTYGASVPASAYSERRTNDKPTDAQKTLIDKLIANLPEDERPDLAGVTRAQASELIDSLKAGTYDPGKWTVPF